MLKKLEKMALLSIVLIGNLYGGFTPTVTIDTLMWEDTKNAKTSKYIYSDALGYCKNLTLDSHSDWRVPTIKELFTIVDYTKRRPAVMDEFVNVNKSGEYWSNTPMLLRKPAEDKKENWAINFYKGRVSTDELTKDLYIRCVRNINNKTIKKVANITTTLTYKDFNLAMDKSEIPSIIKLKKTDLMSSKINTYKYIDINNNNIKIGDYNLNVSFVISEDTNKVHHIIYTSKNIGNISSSQLKSLVELLTNKPLKSQNISGVFKHSNTEKIDGIKYEIFGLYGDKNSFLKGEVQLIQRASDIKKSKEEIMEMAKKIIMKN